MISEEQKQFSTILESITDELDLPQSKYLDAKEKYENVGSWLGDDKSELYEYEPKISPQGSFRLGTMVKPLGTEEYDIDLVCELAFPATVSQDLIYKMVGQRLKNNGHYSPILESKNRCWRLNYHGDFHMDILPAIPDIERTDSSLLVPDKELSCWKTTNPEGYANWFLEQMKTIRHYMFEKAQIAKVPEYYIKTPLQRAVQILKRHRDIVFENDLDDKPVSIIITTLAAKAYNNEPDLFQALINIIDDVPNQFDNLDGEIAVFNPTNIKENFADKWNKHPERKQKFLEWLKMLKREIRKAIELRGIPEINKALNPMFGEKIVDAAWQKQAMLKESSRTRGNLKIDKSGTIATTGTITIPKNTFYGD